MLDTEEGGETTFYRGKNSVFPVVDELRLSHVNHVFTCKFLRYVKCFTLTI